MWSVTQEHNMRYKVKVEDYEGTTTLAIKGRYPEKFMTAINKLEQELVENFEKGRIGETEIKIKFNK